MPASSATRLTLPGRKIATSEVSVEPGLADFLNVEVVAASEAEPAVRGTAQESFTSLDTAQDDDIVELEYETGLRRWVSVAELREELAEINPDLTKTARGVQIPSTLAREAETRGWQELKDFALKTVKILRVNPADALADELARMGAQGIARHFENKLKPGPGLYRFTDPSVIGGEPITSSKALAGDAPLLIFLHGTASSSAGSFGGLAGTAEWQRLQKRYGERIFAFEHRTLSESPVENTLQLAKLIPAGARLHLVSHSRGGLIGELLCLAQTEADADALVEPIQEAARKTDDAQLQKLYKAEAARLKELYELLRSRRFTVERFVRVACPARGTILAAKRLDLYLSVLLNAIGLIPALQVSPTYHFVKAVLLALAKQRTRPDELPGLEAMMPTAPLISVLNGLQLSTQSDLAVIAGDIEGAGIFGKLKSLAVYAYFLEQNDLVVNTGAMDGGLRRAGALRFFEEGTDVNHFSYFRNDRSRQKLTNWLTESGDLQKAGFELLTRAVSGDVVVRPSRAAENLPVVFVLPGIMGSHLRDQKDRIWLSLWALARGGMRKLEIGDPDISADALVGKSYQRLVDFLQSRYDVKPFPYDWRRSIADAAAALAQAIEAELNRHNKPIRLLAHSMGGLVARAMIANHTDVWGRVRDERQGRLVMLGTPNYGSYVIPQLLLGQERMVRMLALLDIRNDMGELLDIIRHYPGIVDMLPEQFFDANNWTNLKDAKVPEQGLLVTAKKLRADLTSKAVDPERMVYVAGTSDTTPCEVKVENGRTVIYGTPRGDGRVTYDLGLLPGVRTWYIDAVHGDMADSEGDFPAFVELLEKGETQRLRVEPHVQRGAEVTREIREAKGELFPTEEELFTAALGGETRRRKPAEAWTLQVSVVHGDLKFASHPVAVGHYQGDTIVSAEKYLDRQLGGRLSERYQMNLYPGPMGTAEVILSQAATMPAGALIVGLGEVGEITAEKVRQGVTNAALRYALMVAESADKEEQESPGWRSAAISSLLLGTYGGNALSLEGSVGAIVQGVIQANRILQQQGLWKDRVRIDRVELIELYEEVAVQAIHAAHNVAQRPPLELEPGESIRIVPQHLHAFRGGRFQRPADQYQTGWWRRIQITGVPKEDAAQSARARNFLRLPGRLSQDPLFQEMQREFIGRWINEAARAPEHHERVVSELADLFNQHSEADAGSDLQFLNLTDLARVEATLQATQRTLIDQLVAQQIESSAWDDKLAIALFELLIPNTIKDQANIEADVVLVVDHESARYPWELLARRTRTGAQPLALRMGMLRQFRTADFRASMQPARSRNALVIGDTPSGFAELTGAQKEATQVASMLEGREYETRKLIKAEAATIMGELFARDYSILHLAAHGVFNEQEPERSGMVLGNGMFLTTRELTNLRAVPELVFINCCHLGEMGRLRTNQPHRLAASIAEELIKIGVRAVIAAGWAVNDEAASTFATEFYSAMFGVYGDDRRSFGKAVLHARKETHQRHSRVNTWGAYQCYGDPGFRLELRGSGRKSGAQDEWRLWSQREYYDEVRNLIGQIDASNPSRNERLRDQLTYLHKTIAAHWLDGGMLATFAEAWGELGDFVQAVELYQRAIASEDARARLRAIEQLANLEARYAEYLLTEAASVSGRATGRRKKTDPKQLLDSARQRLEWLIARQGGPGETLERLSLLGGVYKRLAIVSLNTRQRNRANQYLKKAESYYGQAHHMHLAKIGSPDAYLALNWVTYRFLTGAPETKELLAVVNTCRREAEKSLAGTDDFWRRTALPDALLLESLLSGALSKEKTQQEIIKGYQRAFLLGPSPRERATVLEQIEFLQQMLVTRPKTRSLADGLKKILAALNV